MGRGYIVSEIVNTLNENGTDYNSNEGGMTLQEIIDSKYDPHNYLGKSD